MVGGVWIGNDDYSSTNRMTGGSLPAMTWHEVMAYAHQGIEVKTLRGLTPAPAPPARTPVASASEKGKGDIPAPPLRPTVLTQRGTEILARIERMMEDASRALAASGTTVSEHSDSASRSEAMASAAGGSASGALRGN
jgi:penicillin-binding protein 1A